MNKTLKVISPAALEKRPKQPLWMINNMWAHLGVGIIAGAPKSCKTWMALEIAVSVASNTHCLTKFPVATPGKVLLYMAEDSLSILHHRLKSLANYKSLNINELNIGILVPDSLRLDNKVDQQLLDNTVNEEKPVLLILDPIIRMHAIDENSSGDVSLILAYLRNLQRKYNIAVCVVHHAKKNAGNGHQPGLSIRGSSDFHAWGDTNLYLKKKEDHLILSMEQRAAPAVDPIQLKLCAEQEDKTHLQILNEENIVLQKTLLLSEKIILFLNQKNISVTQKILRDELNVRNQSLIDALKKLQMQGKICRKENGWVINSNPIINPTIKSVPVPVIKKNRERNKYIEPQLPFDNNNYIKFQGAADIQS